MFKFKKTIGSTYEKENCAGQCCKAASDMKKSVSEENYQDSSEQVLKAFALGHSLGRMWF